MLNAKHKNILFITRRLASVWIAYKQEEERNVAEHTYFYFCEWVCEWGLEKLTSWNRVFIIASLLRQVLYYYHMFGFLCACECLRVNIKAEYIKAENVSNTKVLFQSKKKKFYYWINLHSRGKLFEGFFLNIISMHLQCAI